MKINRRELRKRRKQADEDDLLAEQHGYLMGNYLVVRFPLSPWWFIVRRGKNRHKIMSQHATLYSVLQELDALKVPTSDYCNAIPICTIDTKPDKPSLASRFRSFCHLPFTSK